MRFGCAGRISMELRSWWYRTKKVYIHFVKGYVFYSRKTDVEVGV
jgi:hypothetical protein